MKEKPLSSIKNKMNVDRFADLFKAVERFEDRIEDTDFKKLFHKLHRALR